MEIEDVILVSVDDHVVEPAHLFERWAPPRCATRRPSTWSSRMAPRPGSSSGSRSRTSG